MSSINGTNTLRVNVSLTERDAVKLILDFLQQRELYISMLDIERETGMMISGLIHLLNKTSGFCLRYY